MTVYQYGWQWLEWGRASARQCTGVLVGQGSRLIWGGAPSPFIPSAQTEFWETAVILEGGGVISHCACQWFACLDFYLYYKLYDLTDALCICNSMDCNHPLNFVLEGSSNLDWWSTPFKFHVAIWWMVNPLIQRFSPLTRLLCSAHSPIHILAHTPMQGACLPIGSNLVQLIHHFHTWTEGARDRTTNPVISRWPALPPANKIDAKKIVYIVYLLYDEVENVKFKYVWAVMFLFLWTALDKIQNRREVDTLHGGFHVLIHSVLNCHICTDSPSILGTFMQITTAGKLLYKYINLFEEWPDVWTEQSGRLHWIVNVCFLIT